MGGTSQQVDLPPHARAWAADVVLRDGGAAHLRPIAPEDAPALQAFHVGQSPQSTYLRFFADLPRLSERDLRRFTTVDHADRVALVVLVGPSIIGVGRYDRTAAATAEVAFNVSDAHQGRGVGPVLLEHLAAAAREQGIERFVAEVLPENDRMIDVFAEAGYAVSRVDDDGVVEVTVDIRATERTTAVMRAREQSADAMSLRALLAPRSVLVVGASRRPGSVGDRLLAGLVGAGFTGALHVVHPEADAVQGVAAVRRVLDVPAGVGSRAGGGDLAPVDLAVLAVPAAAVPEVVRECALLGVRGLVVVSSGAETGARGSELQRELVLTARAQGMRVVGPASYGVLNTDPAVRLNATLAAEPPAAGGLGLFTQSAASGVAVLDAARRRGLGVSTFVSAGDRVDVSGNDCMHYWLTDPATTAVGMHLETIGNPRKFSRVARLLAREKPVLAVRSSPGAPPGHAVRVTTAPREAFDAVLRQAGVICVDDVHHLLDVAQLLASQPLPLGQRIGVVGSAALVALAVDAAARHGLDVAPPVVLDAEATDAEVAHALHAVVADDAVHAVVACSVPAVASTELAVVTAMREVVTAAGGAAKPVVACLPAVPGVTGTSARVPTYPTPEAAVRALAATVRYAQWRARPPGAPVDPAGTDRPAARTLVESHLAGRTAASGPLVLDAGAATALLACYGIEVAAGGARAGGVDVVLRTAEDALFGPLVTLGVAGHADAVRGRVTRRVPPLTDVDVADLVRDLLTAPPRGGGGAPAVDVAALEDLVGRASVLADDLPEVAVCELSPVRVAPDGVAALAARVHLAVPASGSGHRPGRRVLPPTGPGGG